MDKNILYITFVDFTEQKSGSSVRPKKIYDAFIKEKFNVTLLTGLQNRKLERWKNAFKFFKEIRKNDYDFCYVEPPAGPIFNLCDHLLFLYISKIKKIPLGLFYRDAYWKFADWYEEKGFKRLVINTMHKFDWNIINKTCKIVYFPTETMAELFEVKNKEALPPGAEDIKVNEKDYDSLELIYVGGVSEAYGGPMLLEAMDKLNKTKKINLHLVCREKEALAIKEYLDRPWLKLYHASGEELKGIYDKANIAIIPRKVDKYMDFAMPVKLFEYLSYELPIVATNCKEVSKFIKENEIGYICDDNSDSIYKTLEALEKEDLEKMKENIKIAKTNNNWTNRVLQISNLSK